MSRLLGVVVPLVVPLDDPNALALLKNSIEQAGVPVRLVRLAFDARETLRALGRVNRPCWSRT